MSEKYFSYLTTNLSSRTFITIDLDFIGKLKFSKYYSFIKAFLSKSLHAVPNNFKQSLGNRQSFIQSSRNFLEVNYLESNNPLASSYEVIDSLVNNAKK